MSEQSDSNWSVFDYFFSENLSKALGTSAVSTGLSSAALKQAGYSAVRHSSGKWIATKSGAYVANTIGVKAAAFAFLPWVAGGLALGAVGFAAYHFASDYFE